MSQLTVYPESPCDLDEERFQHAYPDPEDPPVLYEPFKGLKLSTSGQPCRKSNKRWRDENPDSSHGALVPYSRQVQPRTEVSPESMMVHMMPQVISSVINNMLQGGGDIRLPNQANMHIFTGVHPHFYLNCKFNCYLHRIHECYTCTFAYIYAYLLQEHKPT